GHRGIRAPAEDAPELARAERRRDARARDRGARAARARREDACRGARARRVRRTRGDAPMRASAAAKINLGLVVGPLRDDGKHELLTLYQRVAIADRIDVDPAAALSVQGFE